MSAVRRRAPTFLGSPSTTPIAANPRPRICRSRSNRLGRIKQTSSNGPGESAGKLKPAHRIVLVESGQDRACRVAILAHLQRERLRRSKGLVGPEKGDELRVHLLAVKIAGEVEQIGFDHRIAFTEGR